MPKPKQDAEAALQKLGQRLRAGMAEKHPAPSLETVRGAVREQYEQEQKAARGKKPPAPDATKEPRRKPQEPEPERCKRPHGILRCQIAVTRWARAAKKCASAPTSNAKSIVVMVFSSFSFALIGVT